MPRFGFCVIESCGSQVHLNAFNFCFKLIGSLLYTCFDAGFISFTLPAFVFATFGFQLVASIQRCGERLVVFRFTIFFGTVSGFVFCFVLLCCFAEELFVVATTLLPTSRFPILILLALVRKTTCDAIVG